LTNHANPITAANVAANRPIGLTLVKAETVSPEKTSIKVKKIAMMIVALMTIILLCIVLSLAPNWCDFNMTERRCRT